MTDYDYEVKKRYRALYFGLNNIKRSMSNIKSNTNGIKTLAANTVKINKRGIEEDSFNKLNSLNDNISSSLSQTISSVANRM